MIFLSLFALEVLNSPQTIFPNLFFALLPAGIVLVVAAIAWKWELAGAILFFISAIFYIWMVGLNRDWSWYASIAGPAILSSLLFLLDWLQKRKFRDGK
jgi:glycosyltransferase involved in cell wall biosynthesis